MRLSAKPIQTVRKSRTVPLDQESAFELFTQRIDTWWPLSTHSIAQDKATGIRFEGRIGGRVVELTEDETEYSWADVIAWDPPHRFVMAWHPRSEPVAASIVEVRFTTVDAGTTIDLEHRGWEEFGIDEGQTSRNGYDSGWDQVLARFEGAVAAFST